LHLQNCWEFKQCGRGSGGENVESEGLCPAVTANLLDGINNGHNGGRACWGVKDTVCKQAFNLKLCDCLKCDFFLLVQEEEGVDFTLLNEILEIQRERA